MSGQIVDINLLERNYRVLCPEGQESALKEAARQLDERLTETRSATKLTNVEQIAVMTALNLCHEWMQERSQQAEKMAAMEDKISLLQATIKKAIGEPESKSPSKS
ncbi:MAG: cell division protein ZapA [Idiomarinaceae bacterium HL-53]|nr:MAG: cell division protein ZapA [Idiomarinaceae bacterium HL-53]CUS48359.1 cell division protein ZapA [Idiomarinaceae bacterium HL-53]